MIRYKEVDFSFAKICRVFISGSSAAGKTYWTHQLLKAKLFDYKRIVYYHPDFHNQVPVEWSIPDVELFFQPGLPTKEDILELPPKTVIVLDDLFQSASESSFIDYLFRVLSSKRQLHCIIMTQRYYVNTKFAMSIRNCCNYHVLMNNADATVNFTAARRMGLKNEITKASELNQSKPYPYIFIDRTPESRINGFCVFIEIFGVKEVVINSMRYYLFTEADFNASFTKINENVAIRHGVKDKKQAISKEPIERDTTEENSKENAETEPSGRYHSHYARRRQIAREIQKTLRRYKIRTKL